MSEIDTGGIPSHVSPERIFEFDLYGLNEDARLRPDVQQGLTFLHSQAPDVFYTPANGGHWVATRYELMRRILQDPSTFSSVQLTVPRTAAQQPLIPLSMDPPDHTPFRQILMRYFTPRLIRTMEESIRTRARELIAVVADKGECDFMESISAPLPVFVFMEMMGLPAEKFGLFREIVVEWFGIPNGPRRGELAQIIIGHLREVIAARRDDPREDIISSMLSEQVNGRPLAQAELESMSFLLFLAGLDTVANGAGFIFHRLAQMPDIQARLQTDPAAIPAFIDEGLRMSGVVTAVRTATRDVELDGAVLKQGDMIMCPLALAGFDERANARANEFHVDRKAASHLMFSTGPHLCVGQILARMELKVLVEEWTKAIPFFQLSPGFVWDVRIGSIIGLMNLDVVWPTETEAF